MAISQGNLITASDINNHINNTSNPHGITPAQIGAASINHTHEASEVNGLNSFADFFAYVGTGPE